MFWTENFAAFRSMFHKPKVKFLYAPLKEKTVIIGNSRRNNREHKYKWTWLRKPNGEKESQLMKSDIAARNKNIKKKITKPFVHDCRGWDLRFDNPRRMPVGDRRGGKKKVVCVRVLTKNDLGQIGFRGSLSPARGRNFLAGSGRLSVSQHGDARDTLLPRGDWIARKRRCFFYFPLIRRGTRHRQRLPIPRFEHRWIPMQLDTTSAVLEEFVSKRFSVGKQF